MPDIFNALIENIRDLLAGNMSLFVASGQRLYSSFAAIVLAWFGIQSAVNREGGFDLTAFSRLIMVLAFGFAMTSGYDTPIPGIGSSFPGLVLDQASYLSEQIGQSTASEVTSGLTDMTEAIPGPTNFANFHYILTYTFIILTTAAVQATIYMVIGFGLVAQGVLLLLGPIFVPFFIVPKLDFLFWGWLRSFLQYSFYQVVANAFVYVFGRLLLRLLAINMSGMTPEDWLTMFPAMFIFLLVFMYGTLKIPTLTNDLFSGSSSSDSLLTRTVSGAVGMR